MYTYLDSLETFVRRIVLRRQLPPTVSQPAPAAPGVPAGQAGEAYPERAGAGSGK